MMDCARNVTVMDNALKTETRCARPVWKVGKDAGVVGAGRIGKGVARRCRGFRMKILCFDQYQDMEFAEECGAAMLTLIR